MWLCKLQHDLLLRQKVTFGAKEDRKRRQKAKDREEEVGGSDHCHGCFLSRQLTHTKGPCNARQGPRGTVIPRRARDTESEASLTKPGSLLCATPTGKVIISIFLLMCKSTQNLSMLLPFTYLSHLHIFEILCSVFICLIILNFL